VQEGGEGWRYGEIDVPAGGKPEYRYRRALPRASPRMSCGWAEISVLFPLVTSFPSLVKLSSHPVGKSSVA